MTGKQADDDYTPPFKLKGTKPDTRPVEREAPLKEVLERGVRRLREDIREGEEQTDDGDGGS